MTQEEEIEQSLELCSELRENIKKNEPLKPFDSMILDEIGQIIEEEKNLDIFGNVKASQAQYIHEKEAWEIPPEPSSVNEGTKEIKKETKKINKFTFIREFVRSIGSLAFCIVLAIIISFGITKYVAHHTRVEGSSMEPSLHNDDQIIVEEVSYYLHDPERFDIIVFPYQEGIYYIKRIIALPNETIQIKEGGIYINGEKLEEDFGNEAMNDPGLAAEEIKLGKDEYFVLGDNRNASVDSRRAEVGVIHQKDISGRAWFRFYPFSGFGILRHS